MRVEARAPQTSHGAGRQNNSPSGRLCAHPPCLTEMRPAPCATTAGTNAAAAMAAFAAGELNRLAWLSISRGRVAWQSTAMQGRRPQYSAGRALRQPAAALLTTLLACNLVQSSRRAPMPCRAPDYAAMLEYQAFAPGPSENVALRSGAQGYAGYKPRCSCLAPLLGRAALTTDATAACAIPRPALYCKGGGSMRPLHAQSTAFGAVPCCGFTGPSAAKARMR